MSGLEDRLRGAFAAAAETVRPESVAGLPDPSRVPRRRHLVALAAAVAVAVVVIGASVITPLALAGGHGAPSRPAGPAVTTPAAPSSASSAAVTIVPDVVNMLVNPATSILHNAGFRVMVVEQASSAFPPGCVLAQNPVAGTGLRSGATITLTIVDVAGRSATFTLSPQTTPSR